jgi:gliding motility-associated-like protein
VYTNNQCSLNDSAASNALVITPTPSINAGVDVTIFTGDSIQLEAIGTIPGVYSWTPAGLLNDANIYNPYASPNSTTEFTVTLTTADGCRAEDELVIIVKEGAGLYSSFTPNGDGINDVWIIENLEEYPTCTVEIFNRWGNQVFSSVGYAVPWDGTYKGEALPFGVYYYIIQLHDDAEPLQGTVTILK